MIQDWGEADDKNQQGDAENAEGLVHLLDAFQDFAVDVLEYPEQLVFGRNVKPLTKYYVVLVEGDVEPEQFGPFDTERERDIKARELRNENDEDGIYWLDMKGKEPEIGSYSGMFFEEDILSVHLLYRDANNYKYSFDHDISLDKYPDAVKLKEGSEITMGEYGTLCQGDFFSSEHNPEYPYEGYDPETDHDILSVNEVDYTRVLNEDLLHEKARDLMHTIDRRLGLRDMERSLDEYFNEHKDRLTQSEKQQIKHILNRLQVN